MTGEDILQVFVQTTRYENMAAQTSNFGLEKEKRSTLIVSQEAWQTGME